MVIISAPWVVPIELSVIQNGSVVVADGRIIDIGCRDDIVPNYPQLQETTFPCVLMPGLVNAHMHLELSYLQNNAEPLPNQNFTDWVDQLIAKRMSQKYSRDEIIESFTGVAG